MSCEDDARVLSHGGVGYLRMLAHLCLSFVSFAQLGFELWRGDVDRACVAAVVLNLCDELYLLTGLVLDC